MNRNKFEFHVFNGRIVMTIYDRYPQPINNKRGVFTSYRVTFTQYVRIAEKLKSLGWLYYKDWYDYGSKLHIQLIKPK